MAGRKTILIVDDERMLVDMIKLRLEAAGYDIRVAYDGEEALRKTRSAKPDLVILDIMMPKMDGYEVCRRLKKDPEYAKIPVIMLSAKAQEADKAMGEEAGARAYIAKPFEPGVLLDEIKEALAKK